MPKISDRGNIAPNSPIRKLVPLSDAAKSRGVKIYHLNIGQPDIVTPDEGLDALKNINRKTLEYSPSNGILEYRINLVNYYKKNNIDITPEDIIITCGGSEAILLGFLSTLNDGDEIITTEPTYANYITFALSAGAIVKTVPSSIDNGFKLPDIEEFEKIITPKTKAILICNPNNPTGYVYTKEELNKLAKLVKKHDLFFFSDEVYREFVYEGAKCFSVFHLKDIDENAILIDSVSKRYSECGIRIGAIITKNKELRDTIMKFCQARLSPPLIGQIVANESLKASDLYTKKTYDEYISRRDFLIERLNKIPGVFAPKPMGAFYSIARLPVEDADEFCAWCLSHFEYENETIYMAPASGFYITKGLGKNEVRIAYVLNKKDLDRALIILEKALEAFNNRK